MNDFTVEDIKNFPKTMKLCGYPVKLVDASELGVDLDEAPVEFGNFLDEYIITLAPLSSVALVAEDILSARQEWIEIKELEKEIRNFVEQAIRTDEKVTIVGISEAVDELVAHGSAQRNGNNVKIDNDGAVARRARMLK